MPTIQELITIEGVATLQQRQATFISIELAGSLYRIDFIGKRQFNLKAGATGKLSYYTDKSHPMLIPYNDDGATTYLSSAATDPETLMAEIQRELLLIPQDWMGGHSPFFGGSSQMTIQNLRTGSGILLDHTPRSVHDRVVAVCEQHGIQTKSFFYAQHKPYALLILDTSYVIAASFNVTALA